MDFLDLIKNENSQDWEVDFKGALWMSFVQASTGCLMGGAVSVLPYPIFAKVRMRQIAQTAANDICLVWRDATNNYWKENHDGVYEFDKILHDVHALEAAVASLSTAIDEAWWESFGTGNLEETRKCLGKLQDALSKDLDHMPPVLKAAAEAQHQSKDEKEKHKEAAKVYLFHIEALVGTTSSLMKCCTDIACQGGIEDDEEEEDLRALMAETR